MPEFSDRYGPDVLARRPSRQAPAVVEPDGETVVEEAGTGFCGLIVAIDKSTITLEDRHGRRRVFPLTPGGFLLDGVAVSLVRPRRAGPDRPARSASGSRAVPDHRARVARASRIWVEGLHDAVLLERVWGHDLRVEGVVVEPLGGVDDVVAALHEFGPAPGRRVGILVDHLVAGTKESRLAAAARSPHVLVTGHPYVDVWQAVKPAAVGIAAWPQVPRGQSWKEGVCAALGWGSPAEGWRRVHTAVSSYADLEVPLLGAVERLIDFVTEPPG